MIDLAISNYPYFYNDAREITKGEISYTVDTLRSIREENPNSPLCFVMSMDAFAHFDSWHKWQEILQLAHLIVANREGSSEVINETISSLLKECQTSEVKDVTSNLAGNIYLIKIKPCPISATMIRDLLKSNKDVSDMISPVVWNYIQENKLYTNSA